MGRSPGWHHEDIKAALRKQYGSMSVMALQWGYHRGAITRVLRRPFYSIPLERRVSEALHVPLHVLWPDRWHPDGTPKPRFISADTSRRPASPHRQKHEVA